MKTYLEQLQFILDNGERRENRTGVDTLSVFGMMSKYDLRLGFPLLTTKKVNFAKIVRELLWFIRGETNIAGLFEAEDIWKAWADENGDLGPIYGQQFTRWEAFGPDVGLVDQREPDTSVWRPEAFDRLTPTNDDDICGAVYTSNSGDEFTVIARVENGDSKNSYYLCQFKDEVGFPFTASRPNIRQGSVVNPYRKSIKNVGYYGEPYDYVDEHVYTLWRNMIVRCYDPQNRSYAKYGDRGVTVHSRWHCFAEFVKDLPQIPFYSYWKDNPSLFHLDKDYYGANQYGPNTCLFADWKTNRGLKDFAIESDGRIFTTVRECAESLGVDKRRVSDHLNGGRRLPHSIKRIEHPKGQLYRKRRTINQLKNVIERIKTNPSCRRLIVSAWNVADLDKMALAPCHVMFHFNVTNEGFLDLALYQRSCDFPVGVPFNIASYALLMHMVAQECNLIPRIFTHFAGDAHIYVNQIDGVKKQLLREPLPLPQIKIKKKPFFEIEFEDIELLGYQHHGFIKFPVAT